MKNVFNEMVKLYMLPRESGGLGMDEKSAIELAEKAIAQLAPKKNGSEAK